MKLVELKCRNCGAVLKVLPDSKDIHCEHCKANYKLDDEVHHIKYDDMEKAGYDYERGKLRAHQEHELEKQRQRVEAQQAAIQAQKDAKLRKWKILGMILLWIYFLPIMASYYIWKKTKFSKEIKIVIIAAIWLFSLIFFAINSASEPNYVDSGGNSANDSSYIDYDKKYQSLLGESERNPFYDNEKKIRNFVIAYNEMFEDKILQVEWRNNHTKAYVYFVDKRAEVHSSTGISFKFGFSNGKESVSGYDEIICNIAMILNYKNDIDGINEKLLEGRVENGKTIELNSNIYVTYDYSEQQVGYQSADHYWITIETTDYNIDNEKK